jgi:hypothetical protein
MQPNSASSMLPACHRKHEQQSKQQCFQLQDEGIRFLLHTIRISTLLYMLEQNSFFSSNPSDIGFYFLVLSAYNNFDNK